MEKTTISLIPPPPEWQTLLSRVFEEERYTFRLDIADRTSDGDIERADALIAGILREDLIEKALKLRFLQVPFAGTDRIDLESLRQRGVAVATAHENAVAVAEHGMLLLLSLTKRLVNQDRDLRRGMWHGWVAGEPNLEAFGKTLGIIGLGRIGFEVARRAKCFGMRVIGTKADPEKGREELMKVVDEIHPTVDLDSIISKSDFLFVSVPLARATKGLIGKRQIRMMDGKYLINVSRGEVVDEEALYLALKEGILKGAGIDAWYAYPREGTFAFPSRYPFHELRNVIMTPHTAGYTFESELRNWEFSFRNIAKFFKDGSAQNVLIP
jgi:phosphoglycerate dehydrogenase-like enzyme